MGNDIAVIPASSNASNFNPRSRVGNDGLFWYFQRYLLQFQSTFPRGERRGIMDLVGRYADISIHVPAWGTTKSAHADLVNNKFQSTFPRGERPFLPLLQLQLHNFNPRSRVGNDTYPFTEIIQELLFQSTFPRGERHHRSGYRCCHRHFNPRSRVGNDFSHKLIFTHFHNFNPRSRVGNDRF